MPPALILWLGLSLAVQISNDALCVGPFRSSLRPSEHMVNRVDLTLCAFLALVMLGMSCNSLVLAQPICTPQTCPPNTPVVAYFEYSNCTGDVRYRPVPMVIGTCQNESTTSIQYFVTDEAVGYRMFLYSSNCGSTDQDPAFHTISYQFGICSPMGLSKRDFVNSAFLSGFSRDELASTYAYSMYLRHVNASYEAPQEPVPLDMSYPSYHEIAVEGDCYSANNCTFNGQEALIWSTVSTNSTCSLDGAESGMIANITAGVCYRYFGFYARFSCPDETTYRMDIMVGHGCEHVLVVNGQHASCGPGSLATLHCTAAPVNEPIATPSSAESTLGLASITLALILLIVTSIISL